MATDLSARSDRALERAVNLAGQHKARLVILNIIDEDLPASVQDRVRDATLKEIQSSLEKVDGAKALSPTIDAIAGKDYRDILDHADEIAADLIVMGIHRNEAGNKPIAGTTMERVIRKGQQPVLVVPNRTEGAYRKVAIGVDFSAFSRIAIRQALSLAPGAEFNAIHSYHVPFGGFQRGRETRNAYRDEHERALTQLIEEEMETLIASATTNAKPDIPFHTTVKQGETQSVIRSEVDRLQPDLLVLGTHGRVGLTHALLGSIAETFLNNPPCDVLVVKAW
ncbi:universal stress protein [Parvibaculaceae bacterium PLY_AMNH_Bact1]|nr:universal stress protein [Parvibaculaceae bacterium PLY_AMNH_Bact1]